MDQLESYADERLMAQCVYCGAGTETRDHVPSKVFLDAPHPPHLPHVPACEECNNGFSLDEQYVACLVDCALTGQVHAGDKLRDKVRATLEKRPSLASRISQAREESLFGDVAFRPEFDRVRNVVVKLARGHAAYELSEPQFGPPNRVWFKPLIAMTVAERNGFEVTPSGPLLSGWPEVGSRMMQRVVMGWPDEANVGWLVVQPSRYRYLVSWDGSVLIRAVIGEYLAFEVAFD